MKIQNLSLLIVQFIVIFPLISYAQKIDKPADLSSSPIKLENAPAPQFANELGVRGLQLADVRMDTLKIGFASTGNSRKFVKLELEGGMVTLKSFLQKRYAAKLNSKSDGQLAVFIKRLWFQQKPVLNSMRDDDKIVYRTSLEESLQVTAVFDVYLEMGEYYQAVARIDTNFTIKNKKRISGALADLFDYTLEKANAQLIQAQKKRHIPKTEVWSAYYFRKQKAKVNDPVPKGVYLTFQDFLDRKPVHTDCTIELGAKSDHVYVNQNGQGQLIETFWGASDGTRMFIKLSFNLFPIHAQQHTYELMGSEDTYHVSLTYNYIAPSLTGGATLTTNTLGLRIRPLQLNMDTGKPF